MLKRSSAINSPNSPGAAVLLPPLIRQEKVARLLLVAAFYLLLFSNLEGFALPVQLVSIALVCICASVVFTMPRLRQSFSLFDTAVLVCCMFSIPSVIFNSGSDYPKAVGYIVLFSFVTFIVMMAISVIVSRVKRDTVLQSASYAYVGMVTTICIFFSSDVLTALTPNAADRWALRTRAFDLHPNLEGWIFAGGSLILMRQAMLPQTKAKWLYVFYSILSFMIVMAASARGSMLAVAAACRLKINDARRVDHGRTCQT